MCLYSGVSTLQRNLIDSLAPRREVAVIHHNARPNRYDPVKPTIAAGDLPPRHPDQILESMLSPQSSRRHDPHPSRNRQPCRLQRAGPHPRRRQLEELPRGHVPGAGARRGHGPAGRRPLPRQQAVAEVDVSGYEVFAHELLWGEAVRAGDAE